ncbi:MAG: S1 RNA-binding domain-containing protein [Eubacteriales bacterium]|nr:S1 RNA-binding domain-containing protein [Eubacteriales bacterium]
MEVQRQLLSYCVPGDVLRGIVTAIDADSVRLDLGGAVGVIPRDRIALSPVCGPERFAVGDVAYGAVHRVNRTEKCLELTHRELLGTFPELVEGIQRGCICRGIWCGGGRVELAPNLMAVVRGGRGETGKAVTVQITGVDGIRCQLYAEPADSTDAAPAPPVEFNYYITNGRLKNWRNSAGRKNLSRRETVFWR